MTLGTWRVDPVENRALQESVGAKISKNRISPNWFGGGANFESELQGGILRYPYEALTESTDYLQIDIVEYRPTAKGSGNNVEEYISRPGSRSNTLNNRVGWSSIARLSNQVLKNTGTIILQIPSQIEDGNSVSYGSANLNGVAAAGVGAFESIAKGTKLGEGAGDAMNQVGKDVSDRGKTLANDLGGIPGMKDIATKYFASKAAGALGANLSVNQLMARSSGQIFNPNMELLFNGPTLRNFRFAFKMTPRNSKEAEQIKLIIRTFKRNMAPKTSTQGGGSMGNMFIKTPNVFELRYKSGNSDHPFLHKFKQCFLTDISVNYTGDGVYATYDDATPVSMIMNLSFKELEPIYDVDYESSTGYGGVGY